jgi:epoxyqueuosine reductase
MERKSVISILLNYYPVEQQLADSYKISKYAYGADYHFVIKEKLNELFYSIQEHRGSRWTFVDSAPVLDKAWAAKVA